MERNKIRVLYEDEAILVAEKPAGLLTIATEKVKTETLYYLLNEMLKKRKLYRERIFIVHRLDRDASGLLVFAKNERAKRTLQADWENVEKKYYAVAEGAPLEASGEIRSHLVENKAMRTFSVEPSERSRLSVTHYRLLKKSRSYSLLEIRLDTGRKHQIRAHLSELGIPIVGDEKYGAQSNPLRRLGLHAFFLSIFHPVSGKKMTFESKLPEIFKKLL